LAGHFQVENEAWAAFAIDDRQFPAPPHASNPLSAENREPAAGRPPQERFEQELGAVDHPAGDPGCQASDDRFDFGQFRHAAILSKRFDPVPIFV
jgi:hypothetical protein